MVLQEFDLSGKVALVTGAGRGIGKAIALTLAEAGADIAAAARTREQLEEAAGEIRQLGKKCLTIPTDVTQPEQVQRMAEKSLAEFGKIDILVNNAGLGMHKPLVPLPDGDSEEAEGLPNFFTPFSEQEWDRVMDTNVKGVFLCTRAVAPSMLERREGKVINISSLWAAKAWPEASVYCASKGAVALFTRSLAREWAPYNINVNAIAPGFVRTPLSEQTFQNKRQTEKRLSTIPLGRPLELRDIGLLAVYLASPASRYITGQAIYLDGGELA